MSGKPSNKHVIVLNGKHYDTKTGQLIHNHVSRSAKPHSSKPTAHKPTQVSKTHATDQTVTASRPTTRPHNIDGFTRVNKPATHQQARRSANHAARKPQRSQTVMRAAAKPPAITVANPVEQPPQAPIITLAPVGLGLDPKRVERAKHIRQDKRISRFGVIEPSAAEASAAPQATIEATQSASSSPPEPTSPAATAPAPIPESRLDQAIAAATSHTQPKHVSKTKRHHRIANKLHMKPRTLRAATAAVMVIGIGGVIVRQNMPAIQVQLASNRAGISSSIPANIPAGYNMQDGVDYSDGEVVLTYQSQANDGRTFRVSQTESFWTSESLRENYIETLDSDYQVIQENGKTIYLYDNGATWVDGGIWYKIDAGQAALSSTQLMDIINGL
jgi:hypothetical protein